jgi:hypothetical protein
MRLAFLATFSLGFAAHVAVAADDTARPRCSDSETSAGEGAGKTKYEVVTGPDGKKIFRIKTGFVICGKVPKPEVLYGLLNSNINYEWESMKQDFLPKVLHSVEQSPF